MDNKTDNKFYDAVCNKTFSNQSALNKHLKTESHLKKVQFLEVKKVNKDITEEAFKKEKKAVKKDVELKKKFYCPLCEFKTKNKKDLETHIKTNTHKINLQDYKNTVSSEEYKKFNDDLKDGLIFIGKFKNVLYNKETIDEKYKIQDTEKTLRAKYGSNVGSNKQKNLLERIIYLLEDIQAFEKKLIKKYKKDIDDDNTPITKRQRYKRYIKNTEGRKTPEKRQKLIDELKDKLKNFDKLDKDEQKVSIKLLDPAYLLKEDEEEEKEEEEEEEDEKEEEEKDKIIEKTEKIVKEIKEEQKPKEPEPEPESEEEEEEEEEEEPESEEEKEEDVNDLIDYIKAERRKVDKLFSAMDTKDKIDYPVSKMYLYEEDNDFINAYEKLDEKDKDKAYPHLLVLYQAYKDNFKSFLYRSLINIKDRKVNNSKETDKKYDEIDLFEKYDKLDDKLDINTEKSISDYIDLIKQFNKDRKKLKLPV